MAMTWQQFISIPNGTRIFNHGADQCVAVANLFHEEVLGGAFIPVSAARQWWERSWPEIDRLYTKSLFPQAGAIFVALGGIYDRTYGHIGGVVSEAYTDGSFDSVEQNAGSGAARWFWRFRRQNSNDLFGFLIPKNNPAKNNKPLEPHQRRVHASSPVKKRFQPTSKSKDMQDDIPAGVVGDFDAWIYGESVSGINIWFRGAHSGAWCWAGGFTSQSTVGLTDLNPKTPPAVQSTQRQVHPVPVNVRRQATTTAETGTPIDANSVVAPEGWVRGQAVQGINTWFKVAGWFAWAGGFTSQATTGLKDLNSVTPPITDPPLPTDPTGPDPKTTGSPGAVLATIDDWDMEAKPWGTVWERPQPASVFLEFPDFITERTVRPTSGYYTGRPGKPNHFGVHHADGVNLDGVVNHLMGQNGSSTSLVVKDHEAVYMVDSRDTPATNGRFRSNQFSFTVEMCNDKVRGDRPSEATHETVAWAFAREAMSWGMLTPLAENVTVLGHKVLAKKSHPTACPGMVDIPWIVRRANEIIVANQHQTEPPAPDFSDLSSAMNGLSVVLRQVLALLKRIFNIGDNK